MEGVVVKTEPEELAIEYDELSLDVVKQENDIESTQLERPDTVFFPKPIKFKHCQSEIPPSQSASSQNDSNSDVQEQADVLQSSSRCSSYTESRDTKYEESSTYSEIFECAKCSEWFEIKNNLINHIVECGKTKEKTKKRSRMCYRNADAVKSNCKNRDKRFPCSVCEKMFSTNDSLKCHMRTHTGEKPFSCPICQKAYSDRSTLRTHMSTHTNETPYACTLCDKSYKYNSNLKKHLRNHPSDTPFACSMCEECFKDRVALKTHMVSHGGQQFACALCNKKVASRKSLKNHMRIHTGEKPFSCAECQKSFNCRSNLRNHMRVHTRENPFSCSECHKSFNYQSTLRNHMRIHTGETPYSCTVCQQAFRYRSYLKKHVCNISYPGKQPQELQLK